MPLAVCGGDKLPIRPPYIWFDCCIPLSERAWSGEEVAITKG